MTWEQVRIIFGHTLYYYDSALVFLTADSNPSELTDKGRQTTSDLGNHLRRLYVDQLGFLPKNISHSATIYLRASPFPRALDSVQQIFTGLYPPNSRASTFLGPVIFTRTPTEETLLPNEVFCSRFLQLIKAYSQRTAERCESPPS